MLITLLKSSSPPTTTSNNRGNYGILGKTMVTVVKFDKYYNFFSFLPKVAYADWDKNSGFRLDVTLLQ